MNLKSTNYNLMEKKMNKLNNKKIEFHILQSFPVSCLNRDDVGSPKTAIVGGINRARVSSQCWKRQVRLKLHELGITLGIRTKNVKQMLFKSLEQAGATQSQCENCSDVISKSISDDTLIFISQHEIAKFVEKAKELNFDDKKLNIKELSKLEKKYINKNLDALDIALFGRMVAKVNDMNIEAAASFNHAISTHAVSTDIDYFTALDDLSTTEQGASHLGTTEFNSATYYRYVCLDLGILAQNLGIEDIQADKDSIKTAISAFIKALVIAVPEAKQKTMSASSIWDYAKVLVRKGQPLQLNFEAPIRAKGQGYLEPSIEHLQSMIKSKQKLLGSLYAPDFEKDWGIDENYSLDNLISDIEDAL